VRRERFGQERLRLASDRLLKDQLIEVCWAPEHSNDSPLLFFRLHYRHILFSSLFCVTADSAMGLFFLVTYKSPTARQRMIALTPDSIHKAQASRRLQTTFRNGSVLLFAGSSISECSIRPYGPNSRVIDAAS
jgi:hypothetical protein